MKILSSGERKLVVSEWFHGRVWLEPLIDPTTPARLQAARVTFDPGAYTAWHKHPLGQMLHVTAGVGRAQVWGEPVREINAGDFVWFKPGEKNWHGASPNQGMVHVAIHEMLDGGYVTWLQKVTDAEFDVAPSR